MNMPVTINGQNYYRTAEVCRAVGISRNTLFRWIKEGVVFDVELRDCRGWRVFTQEQVEALKGKTTQVISVAVKRSS
jgi:predicted site-specific integrase-resolvase